MGQAKIINYDSHGWVVIQCAYCNTTRTIIISNDNQYRCSWCGTMNRINIKTILLAKKHKSQAADRKHNGKRITKRTGDL